ncbi:WD40-repeat-containing domain protein [Phycomyces nitens]|nr:WD40-repeat-containing domain protein [Phycomyces nitens]
MKKHARNQLSGSGRMQRIVSQAGLYAAARLSSEPTESQSSPLSGLDEGQESDPANDSTTVLRSRMSGALNALSISPDGESVAVAGREVLKIIAVTKSEVVETLNLRAGSHLNLNYSSNDVKWGNNATKNKVATAATNGAIILWDLNKVGRKAAERVINEHARAVNRVCFQPENGNVLLSASQDGSMKCWDLRDPKNAALHTFEGKSESVRDVQFNPLIQYEFAAAFETGTIQKWDMRNPKAMYERKVSAHNGPCLTVDWHHGGRMVASGGRDKTIKVWDMSADSRRPLYSIRTMAAVARIQWRPGYDDEIASCALLTDSRIHVWDVRRPNIAKYAFDEHETTPTGFLWLNSDTIYSVAKDKWFIRQEIQASYRPVDLLKRNAIGWNVQGDLAFAIDQSSREHFVDEGTLPQTAAFMSKKWRRPPTKTCAVEDEFTQYIPAQNCGIAHLPLFDFEAFSVFAEHYQISSKDVAESCENNSLVAWKMGRYRTSQTWKIVALLFDSEDELSEPDDRRQQDVAEHGLLDIENEDTDSAESSVSESEESDENTDQDKQSIRTSFSDSCSEAAELWPKWQHEGVVMELLDYYTEQGDVQMCVTLYLVLEHYIHIDDIRVEDWFTSYIDLLHRFKLWSPATAMIKACRVKRVRERNENATTIHIACNHCFKVVMGTSNGSWACDKCRRLLNPCSICHQTVRGLYVWCQGCNHGGHLDHMREWFSKETLCATGCGHTCVLKASLPG